MENNSPELFSFKPIFDADSRILILGTMPSPASLRAGMYYSHPQNAFWRILGDITGENPGKTNREKADFLLRNHVAVWDTLASCVRPGALDSDIRETAPNDIPGLIQKCPGIKAVFLNGSAALRFFKKFHAANVSLPFFALPSTSPANCRGGYAKKYSAWKVIGDYLK